MAFQFNVANPGVQQGPSTHKMIDALTVLGYTTNLKLCLDASDSASYSGAGQSWLDRSGGGYDFFRGSDGTVQASDPTFNGVAGSQSRSEYWSFDGGDFFRYDNTTEPWINALHQAGAVGSWCFWVYLPTGFSQGMAGNNDLGTGTGFTMSISSTSMNFTVSNGGVSVYGGLSGGGLSAILDNWNFYAGSVNAAGNTALFKINGASGTKTCTYTLPNAGAATYALELGSRGNGNTRFSNGVRMANACMWQGTALSATDLDAIYQYTRTKFNV